MTFIKRPTDVKQILMPPEDSRPFWEIYWIMFYFEDFIVSGISVGSPAIFSILCYDALVRIEQYIYEWISVWLQPMNDILWYKILQLQFHIHSLALGMKINRLSIDGFCIIYTHTCRCVSCVCMYVDIYKSISVICYTNSVFTYRFNKGN